MVSNRCKITVKSELEKLGFESIVEELGEVEIMGSISADQLKLLNIALKKTGLELLNDKKSMITEKIKNIIIEFVHYSDKQLKINFSDHISNELHYDYTYLANLFSANEGITIERFLITHKIEHVKELLIYEELNLSEIAFKLHYSSVSPLSNQFMKITG